MRINLLIHKLIARNGLQRLFLNLANELANLGNEVSISAYLYNENVIPENVSKNLQINAVVKFDGIKMTPPSILSSFYQGKEYFISSRKWAASITEKNFDVINAYEEIAHKAAINLKKRNNCPIAWCLADPPVYADKGARIDLYRTSLKYRLALDIFAAFDRPVVRQLDGVFVLDNRVKKIVDDYYDIDSKVVRLAGIDTNLFVPRSNKLEVRSMLEREMHIPIDATLVLSVSIMMWYRRFEDAILAIAKLNEKKRKIHYLIVGNSQVSPDYYQFLKKYIEDINATKFVHFIDGAISDSHLVDLYNSCDIFVFPNDNQTWGMAPLEAMSVGKPVVVTKGAGIHEVLEAGKTALIAEKHNPDSLVSQLELLIEDESLAKNIAINGNQFVRENLSRRKCAERLVESLKLLCNQGRISPIN